MDAPYLIVVADAKNQIFAREGVRDALTEAVFGDEQTVFVDGKGRREHAKNGFWSGPNGVRNEHVSAAMLLPDAGIWRLREKKWQPLLTVNPWAKQPIPDVIKCLTRLEADADRWVLREGKSVADALDIPVPWPPVD
jgi:hypothetical protein